MTYDQALAALEARQETRIELGLDRVRAHLRALGSPQRQFACIHVAGTNGKGSVCAILDSVLRAAGYRTGFYSSPHLVDVRERCRVDGRPISKAIFARLMSRSLAIDAARQLTYFELLTVVAFSFFAEQKVDVAVVETGLGGRLDATNVVEAPLASIITSIDFDHMGFLGRTRGRIAAEKAGIIKSGRPIVCPPLAPAALKTVSAAATRLKSPLILVDRPWKRIRVDWVRQKQEFAVPRLGKVLLGLLGEKQGHNGSLAHAALTAVSRRFPVSPEAWRRGLSRVRWPGRFEVRRLDGKIAVLDGAHNAEAMGNLARTWRASPWSSEPARWIVGIMKDKDARRLLAPIAPFLLDVVAVQAPTSRALDARSLAAQVRASAPDVKVRVGTTVENAIQRWRFQKDAPRTAVICGSFYLIAGAARALGGARA